MKKITSYLTVLLFACIIFLIAADIAEKSQVPFIKIPLAVTIFALTIVVTTRKGVATMTFTQGICEKVQSSLLNIFGTSAPELQRTQLGWIQALMSPVNTSGIEIIPIDQSNGKTRKVLLKYIQRATEEGILTSKPTDCATTVEPAPFEDTVEITTWMGSPGIKFSETEMRKLCEPDGEYMARTLNAQFDALTKNLDKKLIVILQSNYGDFYPALNDTGLWKDVQLIDGSNKNAPLYYGESEIIEDFVNIGYANKPIVVGAGNLSHYVRQTNVGCCNDNGIDLSQAANMYFFHDLNIQSLVGTNHFIAMRPGSVQLITKNDYVGSYAKENDVFSHGTVTDPFTGITWDVKWHYDDCADFWSLQIGLWYKQYFMPSNIFAAADDLFGVNGVLHYRATSTTPLYY